MLPQHLHSSYQQYKSDIDHIATWLATTARRCGFVLNLKTAQGTSIPTKLKGRARMLAKQAAKEETAKSETESPRYAVPLKDFLPMAQKIRVFQKAEVRVPDSFVKILNRAISLRKAVTSILENDDGVAGPSRSAAEQKSDTRHSFFTRTLEAVREELKSRMSTAARGETETSRTATTELGAAANLTNMLSSLEVEEPSEAFQEITSPTAHKEAAEKAQKGYQAEAANDLEEAVLGLMCLLTDYARIRTVVSETWTGYKDGLFDLVNASITTNTAMELARGLEEAQQRLFTAHGGLERLLQGLFVAKCRSENEDPNFKELPGDHINFAMYDVADSLYLPTFRLLEAYVTLHKDGSIPMYKPGNYGVYDATADRSKMSNREKLQEDKIVLLEILPDFCILTLAPREVRSFDELTRGLCEALNTKQISLWLSFSAQLFLDIHHILRAQITRGFKDLCRVSHALVGSINRNLEFHKDLKISTWPASKDDALRQLVAFAQSTCTDGVIETVRAGLREPPGFEVEKHRLRKNHPVWCGLDMYMIKARFYEAGIRFARAWGSLVFTAHLYNAIREEKLLAGVWKDMELLFTVQDEDHLFVGKRSASGEQYFRRFCITLGLSATNFARNRRPQHRAAISPGGPRGILKDEAPVHEIFLPKYDTGGEPANLTTQHVERIISESNWIEMDDPEDDSQLVIGSRSEAERKSRLGKKWNATQQITIPELLRTLRRSLQGEFMEFSFDYFLMHRQCWRLLRSIKDATEPRMREVFGPGYLEVEFQQPYLVGYILMMMDQDEKLAKKFGIRTPLPQFQTASRELLEMAAEEVNSMIPTNASGVVSTMMEKLYNVEFQIEKED